MKFNEIYVPVFEETDEKLKTRQLRADFGSRKVDLVCTNCWHEFTKRIGPNTDAVECPECNNNRVKPALSEMTKRKLITMKEDIVSGNIHSAVQNSLEVIDAMHGNKSTKAIKMMKEALSTLISVERGLGVRNSELMKFINDGTGKNELRDIASKLGHDLFKDEE